MSFYQYSSVLAVGGSLSSVADHSPPSFFGPMLVFQVESMEKELARLAGENIRPDGELKASPEGYRRALFAGPEGQRLCLFEWQNRP